MGKEFREILIGVKRAIALLNPAEKRSLVLATGIMVITGILTNVPAVILGRLVDALTSVKIIHFSLVVPFVGLIVVVILLRETLTVWRKYLVENIATQTDKEQTVRVIERLLKTDIASFLQTQQIGALHGRVFRSMQGLIRLLKLSFLDFAPIFFSGLAAIGIALYQKPLVATVMVLVIPAGLFLIVKQVSSQKGVRVSLLRGKEEIDGKVVEMLSGIETIRVANTVPFEVGKIERVAERLRKTEINHHIAMALFDAAKYLNEGFFYIVVILLSIVLASHGVISRGDILVYSILFLSIVGPLREVHRILDEAHESSLRVHDLYDLLYQPLDLSYRTLPQPQSAKMVETDVRTSHLSFAYQEGHELLRDVSLTIKRGESIGIAGASGCGKTTFIHILLKLLHGYSGEVSLFEIPLETVSREDIAKYIAYVPQRPFIFSGTIKENILYGSETEVTEEQLINAAQKAQIYDEIMTSLGGFSGRVTENGSNLSGGQRQRLAIARVMLSDAKLLIFDEATSALDNTNEAHIQKNLDKAFAGKTRITIAHRLTTLQTCDRILVFDQGRIVQEGSYAKLSTENGLFQEFLRQAQADS